MQNRISVEHHIHSIPLSPLPSLFCAVGTLLLIQCWGKTWRNTWRNSTLEAKTHSVCTTIGLQACTNTFHLRLGDRYVCVTVYICGPILYPICFTVHLGSMYMYIIRCRSPGFITFGDGMQCVCCACDQLMPTDREMRTKPVVTLLTDLLIGYPIALCVRSNTLPYW